jgi:hypothetical protein
LRKKEKKLMNHKNEGRFCCTFFERRVHKKAKQLWKYGKLANLHNCDLQKNTFVFEENILFQIKVEA